MTTHYAPSARDTFARRLADQNATLAAVKLTAPQRRTFDDIAARRTATDPGGKIAARLESAGLIEYPQPGKGAARPSPPASSPTDWG